MDWFPVCFTISGIITGSLVSSCVESRRLIGAGLGCLVGLTGLELIEPLFFLSLCCVVLDRRGDTLLCAGLYVATPEEGL